METILTTTLTASRTIPADAYITVTAGRINRAAVEQDIAAQYTSLTGHDFFSRDHEIEIKFTINKDERTVTHTGALSFMFAAPAALVEVSA